MSYIRYGAILLACGAVAIPAQSHARGPKKAAARAGSVRIAGLAMNGVEARLPTVPRKLVTASLPFNGNQAVAVAISRVVASDLAGFSVELEGQALQHFGGEKSAEVAAAAVVRSPELGLTRGTSGNVAWGNGFSYALTPPTAELGRGGVRGDDTVQLQYHMSFEIELTSLANSRLHYVARLHHRSGVYGIISPSRTGSNYLGLGLRYDLRR